MRKWHAGAMKLFLSVFLTAVGCSTSTKEITQRRACDLAKAFLVESLIDKEDVTKGCHHFELSNSSASICVGGSQVSFQISGEVWKADQVPAWGGICTLRSSAN